MTRENSQLGTPEEGESLIARSLREKKLAKMEEQDPYSCILEELRKAAIRHFVAAELQSPTPDVRRQMRKLARELIAHYQETATTMALAPLAGDVDAVIQRMLDDILGLGELEKLLGDSTIEDIAINGPHEVMAHRNGRWEKEALEFNSPEEVVTLINRAIAMSGRQVSRAHPRVDARLPDGSRVNVIMAPLTEPSPAVSIRLFPKNVLTLDDLVANGTLTKQAAEFLGMAVKCRLNILVTGGIGAGKTTLANALANLIPTEERVVVIEDTRELKIRYDGNGAAGPVGCETTHRAGNVIYLTVHYPSGEGEEGVFQQELVQNCLRMSPDRIIVGEVRGAEVLDMIMAANVGHDGLICTVHANSSREAVKRLTQLMQLAKLGVELKDKILADWIASAFNVAVFIEKDIAAHKRRVTEITEFTGQTEGAMVTSQPLFLAENGKLARTSYLFRREKKLARFGESYQRIAAMDNDQ